MKILMISTDRKIFENKSCVRQRAVDYGALVDELHVIVFNKKSLNLSKQKISENIWLYPTNSINRWFYIFDAIKIGKKIISKDSEWLVTTQDPFEAGIVGWCIAKSRKTKLQLQVHTDFLSPFFVKGVSLNKIRVKMAKFILPKADCIRVVSSRIKGSILSANLKLKSDPVVLPIFINTEVVKSTHSEIDLHAKYPQFDFIILMVSRLEKEKNITLALSAFKQTVKRYPKMGLVVIGDGGEMESLKSQISNDNLQDSVIMEGKSSDVLSFYKTADIFLHTSNYEGYGMVLVEASISGCPIVTTDVGIASEFFKDGESAFICNVGDRDCLVEKLIKLAENKSLKNSFIQKAQKDIDEHIKEKTKKEYLIVYKKLWERCGKSD